MLDGIAHVIGVLIGLLFCVAGAFGVAVLLCLLLSVCILMIPFACLLAAGVFFMAPTTMGDWVDERKKGIKKRKESTPSTVLNN